jgi:hypothetical protein
MAMAAQSVQGVWDRFERWAERYRRICNETIAKMSERGYSGANEGLFLCKRNEFNHDLVLNFNLSEQELRDRVDGKVRFLRGYLRDIMCDGAEYMH